MPSLAPSRFTHLDRIAIGLSGLCAVHCIATAAAVALVSSVAGMLASPLIHEVGLAIAMVLGALALGGGALRHRRLLPIAVGALGLGIMGGAMMLGHGVAEIAFTILGVSVLALGHELNRRSFRRA